MKSPNPTTQNGESTPLSSALDNFYSISISIKLYNELVNYDKKSNERIHKHWKRYRLRFMSISILAITLAIIPRHRWPRQNQDTYSRHVKFSIFLQTPINNCSPQKGHTKLSKQFVRKLFPSIYKDSLSKMTINSKLSTSKKKGNRSKPRLSAEDIASNERVDKYLQDSKIKSRLRIEARKKEKQQKLEEEAKKKKRLERLKEKRELARLQAQSNEEFKETEAICEYLDKSAQEFQEKQAKETKSGSVRKSDMETETDDEKVSQGDSDTSMTDVDSDENKKKEKETEILNSEEETDKTLQHEQEENMDEKGKSDGQDNAKEKPQGTMDKQDVSPDLLSHINSSLNQPTRSNNGEEDDDSVGTTTAGNQSGRNINQALDGYSAPPTTANVVYCKAKIHIPGSEKPTEQLRNTLGMFLTTLLKVDKDFVLYVYKDDNTASYIKLPTQVPEVMSKIKNYFHGRFRPNSSPSNIWPDVRIGFNIDSETFFDDAKSLLDDKGNYGLYKKDIQAAETTDIGFLLFSNVYQDRERVRDAILHQCSHIYLINPQLTLRWRKVIDPSQPKAQWKNGKRQKTNKDEQEVKALYVEVVSGTETQVATALGAMYSKQVTGPDDEKMRFIPSPTSVQHSQVLEKYGDIIRRQAWYAAGIARAACFDLTNINAAKGDHLPKSLRRMIMEMCTKDGNPLFITMDKYWDGSTSFVFPLKYEKEARNRVADLGSYLRFKYGDQVLIRHFTPAAAARAINSPWNEELGKADTPMNRELESIVEDCDAIDWLKAPQSAAPTFEIAPELHNSPLFNTLPNDDNSLDSFRQSTPSPTRPLALNPKIPTLHLISPPRVANSAIAPSSDTIAEDLTEDGDHTITSLASRMSLIENSLGSIAQSINALAQKQTQNPPSETPAFPESAGATS